MTARADERVEIRVPRSVAIQWAHAAALSGKKRSAFIRDAATKEAMRIVEEARKIRLNADEGARFVEALENPARPHGRLRKAAKKLDESGLT